MGSLNDPKSRIVTMTEKIRASRELGLPVHGKMRRLFQWQDYIVLRIRLVAHHEHEVGID
jgi:hypothetical protein